MKDMTKLDYGLKNRILTNKVSKYDYDKWTLKLFPELKDDASLLDIGAGTGKQMFLFAERLKKTNTIAVLEPEFKFIEEIKACYTFKPKLKTYTMFGEDFFNNPKCTKERYDLIYSFYSLYYLDDTYSMVYMIKSMLKKDGMFWVVIPDKGTNKELFSILKPIYNIPEDVLDCINKFPQRLINTANDVGFKVMEMDRLDNKIYFHHSDDLIFYLKNTDFYNWTKTDEIDLAITKYFENNRMMALSKNILSLKFMV